MMLTGGMMVSGKLGMNGRAITKEVCMRSQKEGKPQFQKLLKNHKHGRIPVKWVVSEFIKN